MISLRHSEAQELPPKSRLHVKEADICPCDLKSCHFPPDGQPLKTIKLILGTDTSVRANSSDLLSPTLKIQIPAPVKTQIYSLGEPRCPPAPGLALKRTSLNKGPHPKPKAQGSSKCKALCDCTGRTQTKPALPAYYFPQVHSLDTCHGHSFSLGLGCAGL